MSDPSVLLNSADEALVKKEYAKAEQMLSEVISKTKDDPEHKLTCFSASAKLAGYYSLMGEFEKADHFFNQSQALLDTDGGSISSVLCANFYYDLGFFYDQQAKNQEALKFYGLAKEHYSKLDGAASDEKYMTFLQCYAKCSDTCGELDLASNIYSEVLPLLEQTLGVDHFKVRLLRSSYARLLERTGKTEAASMLLQEEFQISSVKKRPKLLPMKESLKALKAAGYLKTLVLEEPPKSPENSEQSKAPEPHITDVLISIYTGDEKAEERALEDGFIAHYYKYRKETNDLPAELCKLVGEPILKQISYKNWCDKSGNKAPSLGFRRDDGVGIALQYPSMETIVDLFNAVLKDRGDMRRFFQLATEELICAYYLFTMEEANEFSNQAVLEFEDMNRSLNADLSLYERFTAWPGEVKPKHLKRFALYGEKLINGRYLTNTASKTTTVYDIGEWPPRVLFEVPFYNIQTFGRSANGRWHFKGNSKQPEVKGYSILLIASDDVPENGTWLDNTGTNGVTSECHGFFLNEKLMVLDFHDDFPPRIEDGTGLIRVQGLTYPKERSKYSRTDGLVRTNSGQYILLYDSIFYEFTDNNWKEFLNLRETGARGPLRTFGEAGYTYYDQSIKRYVLKEPGKEPTPLFEKSFSPKTEGPSGSIFMRYSAIKIQRDVLFFPASGRAVEIEESVFGFPDDSVNEITYQPTSGLVVGITLEELFSFPIGQIV